MWKRPDKTSGAQRQNPAINQKTPLDKRGEKRVTTKFGKKDQKIAALNRFSRAVM